MVKFSLSGNFFFTVSIVDLSKKTTSFATINIFFLHMKKFFTLLCCAPILLIAQAPQKVDTKAFKEANAQRMSETQSPVINKVRQAPLRKTNGDNPVYGAKTIGNTLYDLQSNNAVASRLMVYPNGKITATWTTSSDGGPSFSQRGSGYNQMTGGVWRKALPNNGRIESSRVGWPSVGAATFGGVEKEYIFAHAVATSGLTGGFTFSTNTGIGTDFTGGSVVLNDTYTNATTPGPIWGRTATAGSRIVMISCFADSTSSYPVNYKAGGIKRPITYSVYDAAAQTWLTKNALLPGYDSLRYDIGQADSYSIDASGNKVRIVIGGAFDDLALWKSEDAGSTWTKTIIDSFARYAATPSSNRKIVNNGAVSVVIDINGVTHVAVPILASAFDSVDVVTGARTTYYSTSLGTEGIAYWNDKINTNTGTTDAIQVIGYTPDANKDGALILGTNTRNSSYGGYGTGLGATAASRISALSNQPMLSYDASGNIFCTYIAPVEDDLSGDDENYNDIFVVYSKDAGKTWADPQNITQTTGFEDFYPTLAKVSDSKLRLMYFLKDDPGIAVNNATNPETNVAVNYMEVPVSKIIHDSVGIFPNGINANTDNGFKVSQNYPNPSQDVTRIDFSLGKSNVVSFTVTDMLGQVLYTETNDKLEAGKHSIYFNTASLSSGIYFYTISAGSQKVTQKMIVE